MITTETRVVNLSQISVGDRFRQDFGDLTALKQDIRENGLIHNLAVVATSDKEKPYKLLAGERRLKALLEIEAEDDKELPVTVNVYTEDSVDELQMKIIELSENLVRKDMHYSEEVMLKKKIYDLMVEKHGEKVSTATDAAGFSKRDTAKFLGESVATTSRDLTLADALEIMPELAEAKTKSEAMQTLRRMEAKAERSRKAAYMEKKVAKTPMEKIKKLVAEGYEISDAAEWLDGFQDSVGFVEIDPPYSIRLPEQKSGYKKFYAGDSYQEVVDNMYEDFMRPILRKAFKALRHDGWIVVWFGPDPWFEPMLSWMRDAGFKVRGLPGIWSKGFGQVLRPDRYLASSYEMFFYGTKEDGAIIKRGRSNVFNFKPAPPTRKIHPTERPIELMEEIISTFVHPDVEVAVPCCGSGNTLLAAANLRMVASGCDINETYRRAYVSRVADADPPNYKSYGVIDGEE